MMRVMGLGTGTQDSGLLHQFPGQEASHENPLSMRHMASGPDFQFFQLSTPQNFGADTTPNYITGYLSLYSVRIFRRSK